MNSLVSEKKQNPPILIVDKTMQVGEALAEEILGDTQVLLVSEKSPKNEKILFVPFEKKFPAIPESTYSHIFLVIDGDPFNSELIPAFQKKAADDKAALVLVLNIRNQKIINENTLEKGTKIIFLGDFVDKNIPKSSLGRIINQAKLKGKITLPGEGMDLVYPIFFQDAVKGILEASFGTSREKIFFIFPRHGLSILSFAHLLQKANPNIKIDFGKEEIIEKIVPQFEGHYLLGEKYPLEEKIRKIGIESAKNIFLEETNTANFYFESEKNKKKAKTAVFFFSLFIFLPLVSTLSFLFIGTFFLKSGLIAIKTYDLDLAGKYIATSNLFLGLSNKTSEVLLSETFLISPSLALKNYSEENFEYTQGLIEFFNAKEFYAKNESELAGNSLKNFLLFAQKQKAKKTEVDFVSDELLNIASATTDTWDEILGFQKEMKYLILFQDNTVLRPTGGIVRAFGIVKLNKGKIKELTIKEPSLLENSSKGHVEPHFALKNFAKSKDLVLKDVSISPDFREVAQDASYLHSLLTDERPDGVISLNLKFLKKLLRLTGPISIKGTKVDETNLFKESLKNSKDTEFLTEVIREILNITKNKKTSFINLFAGLSQNVRQKDLLIAFSKKDIQDIFTVNGLSNSLWDDRKDSPKVINDYLGVSEANMGEANLGIERSIIHNLEIGKEKITGSSNIEIKNNGSSDYKVFLRFILPRSTILEGFKIDQAEKKEISTENKEKALFGIYIEIPKGQAKNVEIKYFLPQKSFAQSSNFNYSFLFIKQPGVDFYPLDLIITFPEEFKVLSFPKGVSGSSSSITFSKNLTQDYKLELSFSKK